MKIRLCLFCVTAMALCWTGNNASATIAGAGTRDSAFYSSTLAKWSIGINAGAEERDVDRTQPGKLDTRSAAFFMGYDVTSWLTLFGTVGAEELKYPGSPTYGKGQLRWSVGLQGNMWRYDVIDPEFLAGTLMLKSLVEYSEHNFSDPDYTTKPEWSDFRVALPFAYEMYVDKQDNLGQTPYSLCLSAGPAVSLINGTLGNNLDFKEKDEIGGVGAVDLYLSHNLSLGFLIEYFSHASMSGNLIYHF
jgi:hypothetical protein